MPKIRAPFELRESLANWAKWRKRQKTFLLLSSIQQHKQPKSTEAHLLTLGPWLPMLEQTLLWPGGVLCIEVPLRHPKSLSTAQAPNVQCRGTCTTWRTWPWKAARCSLRSQGVAACRRVGQKWTLPKDVADVVIAAFQTFSMLLPSDFLWLEQNQDTKPKHMFLSLESSV